MGRLRTGGQGDFTGVFASGDYPGTLLPDEDRVKRGEWATSVKQQKKLASARLRSFQGCLGRKL